jgi:hypothetical protein
MEKVGSGLSGKGQLQCVKLSINFTALTLQMNLDIQYKEREVYVITVCDPMFMSFSNIL